MSQKAFSGSLNATSDWFSGCITPIFWITSYIFDLATSNETHLYFSLKCSGGVDQRLNCVFMAVNGGWLLLNVSLSLFYQDSADWKCVLMAGLWNELPFLIIETLWPTWFKFSTTWNPNSVLTTVLPHGNMPSPQAFGNYKSPYLILRIDISNNMQSQW